MSEDPDDRLFKINKVTRISQFYPMMFMFLVSLSVFVRIKSLSLRNVSFLHFYITVFSSVRLGVIDVFRYSFTIPGGFQFHLWW